MPQLLVDARVQLAWLVELEQSTGLSAAIVPGELETRREWPAELLRDARGMLCMYLPANHKQLASLELVQLGSAGFNQAVNLGLSARGVQVCNASGVNDVPIAEWCVMMMIALARHLPAMFRNQQQGVWDRDARFQQEIRGRTLGIWGYGGIGRETARLASAMGLRIHALTRSGRLDSAERFHLDGTGDPKHNLPARVFSSAEVGSFCESLDFLLLAIPDSPENIGLVDRRVFETLPNRAFLLNPARGRLVSETDLLWALDAGEIAGAALDTHFKYPLPPDHPLWRMPNVIMTPHISGSSQSPRFAERLWHLFRENVARWQAGEPLLNRIAPARLDT